MECPLDEAQSATGFGVDLGDSQVVVIISLGLGGILSIHGICVAGGLHLHGNPEYCTLVDIEDHLPHFGPLNESVQVIV